AALCRGLDSLDVCASGVAPDVIKGIRDAAIEDDAEVEVVMTERALDTIRADPEMRGWFGDVLVAGGRILEHPGHAYLVAACDRLAIVGLNDEAGMPRGLVESTDGDVFDWVSSTHSRCRAEAEPVDESGFAD
ncbi:hypothetical protein ACFQE1_21135, partial [Halobium palmae]